MRKRIVRTSSKALSVANEESKTSAEGKPQQPLTANAKAFDAEEDDDEVLTTGHERSCRSSLELKSGVCTSIRRRVIASKLLSNAGSIRHDAGSPLAAAAHPAKGAGGDIATARVAGAPPRPPPPPPRPAPLQYAKADRNVTKGGQSASPVHGCFATLTSGGMSRALQPSQIIRVFFRTASGTLLWTRSGN